MTLELPILEFDPTLHAILEPEKSPLPGGPPAKVVLCFFQDVLSSLVNEGKLIRVGRLKSEIGDNPIYFLSYQEQQIMVCHPGVGAPLAAGFLEELISMGGRAFIACGGAGALQAHSSVGQAFVLTSAVRDEGTSYHYLPPSREVSSGRKATSALEKVLGRENVPYHLGKTWTTDAIYRETVAKRETRKAEGCEVVEMEAAAFFAVAAFREVEFGQVVYAGDLVVPEGWDGREWIRRQDTRSMLFWLAVMACAEIDLS